MTSVFPSQACRDVGFIESLERREVGPQRRDFTISPFWNVATLRLNLATLPLFYIQPLLVFIPPNNPKFEPPHPLALSIPSAPLSSCPHQPRPFPQFYALLYTLCFTLHHLVWRPIPGPSQVPAGSNPVHWQRSILCFGYC